LGGGNNLTGTLHVFQFQLSPLLPLSLAPVKPANPGSSGKMAVKMERERESESERERDELLIIAVTAAEHLPRLLCQFICKRPIAATDRCFCTALN